MRGVALIALIGAAAAQAAPLRLAVVYGHNGGDGVRAPLRFAENDAARVARALTEVGGVASGDLRLLQGRPVAELLAALDWAKERAATNPDTLLVVYVSSHADAAGLLPAGEPLEWKKLKDRVAATNAKARVTVVDACSSGGLIEAGARPARAFAIQAEDTLTTRGDAFITSSATAEPSLEAGVYQGAVFTQHLLSALRGAADRSGDRKISLEEAYRYAYERTTEGESGQHPGYALRLSGYGELVMATVGEERSGLLLPPGVEEVSVRAADGGERLLFARRPEATRLAVPPGAWVVELTSKGATREGAVVVARNAWASVDEGQLTAVARKSAMLVRLGDGPARLCASVTVERPDPGVASLKDELVRAFGACEKGQSGLRAQLDRRDGKVRVRASLPGGALLEREGPVADAGPIAQAVFQWAQNQPRP